MENTEIAKLLRACEQWRIKLSTIWIFDEIDSEMAEYVCSAIFQAQETETEINIYINSQGGDLYSGIAIINAMRTSSIPIHTTVCGAAYSMALSIAAAGTRGHRRCMKNATYMYHEVQMVMSETTTHNNITGYLEQFKKVIDMERQMFIEVTNFSDEIINDYIMKNHEIYFTVDEALQYGIVDEVIDYADISK